jgi:hypothetical protein
VVSAGSTIYDVDRLSTDEGATLRIKFPALTLQVNAQTTLTIGNRESPEGNLEAQLASGTLVFSSAPTGNIVVAADDASIRPAANVATMTHIRVVNLKELRIYAQRGALEFSYHGERELIPEGAAYRVLLDPSEKEAAALESEPAYKKTADMHYKFLFVGIGIAAGVALPVLIHELESPDKPGPA